MHIYCISLFPEIYTSFIETSLVAKAIEGSLLHIETVNPRQFCTDKHQQIDDYPYGGGAGLVIKAQPIIDAVKSVVASLETDNFKIIYLSPSETLFEQAIAQEYTHYEALIFVSGRYEGIDHRFELWASETYGEKFQKLSLGKFVTLGGELPSMVVIESVVRLLPGVIGDQESWQYESYRPDHGDHGSTLIEHPHYTRPQEVEGYAVPEVLLSGNHQAIEDRRADNETVVE